MITSAYLCARRGPGRHVQDEEPTLSPTFFAVSYGQGDQTSALKTLQMLVKVLALGRPRPAFAVALADLIPTQPDVKGMRK